MCAGNGFQGLGEHGRDVLAVGHSLGGIVFKTWLVDLHEKAKRAGSSPSAGVRSMEDAAAAMLEKLRAVIFIATPHPPALLAKFLSRPAGAAAPSWTRLLRNKGRSHGVLAHLEQNFNILQQQRRVPVLTVFELQNAQVSIYLQLELNHSICHEVWSYD